MNNNTFSTTGWNRLVVSAALLGSLMPLVGHTQGVYRIVGPDGRVSYSDQPPPPSANAKPVSTAPAVSAGGAPLSAELRQAMGRYPVTFYADKDCAPCDNGRNYLNTRGIPYTEKTVSSNDDLEAFKRLSGSTSLPLLTIGGQQIKGFSSADWQQYLDAAGYPKQSALPAGFRRPAPTPLVEAKAVTAPAPAAANAPKEAAPRKRTETPKEPAPIPVENPGGIRF